MMASSQQRHDDQAESRRRLATEKAEKITLDVANRLMLAAAQGRSMTMGVVSVMGMPGATQIVIELGPRRGG